MDKWLSQAEGKVIALTRRDWSGAYLTLPAGVKGILDDIASSMVAKQIITYDMSGYTSRQEATTMLDVNDDNIQKGIKFLEDFKSDEIKTP